MKIGAKTTFFNFVMRERRMQLGWSQKRLADECDFTSYNIINAIECLRMPHGHISKIIGYLNKISQVLDVPLLELFPQDYLDAIQNNKLPRRRRPIIWVREIRIDELPPSDMSLMLPSAEDVYFDEENSDLKDRIEEILNKIPEKYQVIISMRFGLRGYDEMTSREIGERLHIDKEIVRAIEAKALRLLRHPYRSKKIRDYL